MSLIGLKYKLIKWIGLNANHLLKSAGTI